MSAKADSLRQKFGSNIGQAVAMRPGGATPQASPPPPDKYAGAVRSRAFAEMPIEALDCDPQVRTEFDDEDLTRLTESIKRFGQLAPIRARHDMRRNRWVVLVGERRLRACRLAGLERVRVELVEREMTEADVLAEQVVENAVRADLQPVEQGRAYKRLMDLNGWTAQQLGETLGVEPTAVYRALAMLRLPVEVAEKVDAGEIKATAAYEIAKLQIANDQRAVAAKVVAESLDHKATVEEVNRRRTEAEGRPARKGGRGAGKSRPRKVTERTFRLEGYKLIAECRRGIDPANLLAVLETIVAQLRAELPSDADTAQGDPSAAA